MARREGRSWIAGPWGRGSSRSRFGDPTVRAGFPFRAGRVYAVPRMTRPVHKLAPLLFGSGMCALVYQIAWFREFRLIFGASTAATAAVLAIFTGGLGLGGIVLGARVDRHPRPIRLYGQLELLIAAFAATTPGLLRITR